MEKCKVIENDKVRLIEYFNEHWYEYEGEHYPSVTMILNVIAKGFQYEQWLKGNGFNSDYLSRTAMESGSKIHNAIELYLLGEEVKAYNEHETQQYFTWEEWDKFNKWCDWYELQGFEVEEVEVKLVSKRLKCGGTADFIGRKDGLRYLLDWKTGGQYEAHELQISAYKSMYEEMTGNKVDKIGTVYIGANIRTVRDMNAVGVKTALTDFESQFPIFQNALQVWQWKNPNAKPKNTIYPLTRKKGVVPNGR